MHAQIALRLMRLEMLGEQRWAEHAGNHFQAHDRQERQDEKDGVDASVQAVVSFGERHQGRAKSTVTAMTAIFKTRMMVPAMELIYTPTRTSMRRTARSTRCRAW